MEKKEKEVHIQEPKFRIEVRRQTNKERKHGYSDSKLMQLILECRSADPG